MTGQFFILQPSPHPSRQRAAQAVMTAPEGFVVRISEPTRNLEQNALIHAVLTDVGDFLGWEFNGQKVDLDDIKSIFMAAYRKSLGAEVRLIIGVDGQPVILNWRTRELTKRECSDFIEMVGAWMAEKESA